MRGALRLFGASAVVVLVATNAWGAPKAAVTLPAGFTPSSSIEFAGGVKISGQQYLTEMNQLQEAMENDGFSLRKADKKRPPVAKRWAFPGTDTEVQNDKKAFAAKVTALQQVRAGAFNSLIKKGNTRPTPTPAAQKPADEPLSSTYEEAIGNKDKAAIYASFALNDDADSTTVGCSASLEGGVYIFKQQRALAKVVLSGKATTSTIAGGVDVYLVGKMVDGFPKSGSQELPSLSKTISTPEIGYTYGFNPISIGVTAAVAGNLGLKLTTKPEKGAGNSIGKCTLVLTPSLSGSGTATAKVSAVVYQVGIQGKIELINISLPASASVGVTTNPLTLTETFNASLKTTFLDGGISFFVKTNIPQQGEKFYDVDWDTIYSKQFFEWDGFKAEETLADFKARQTPFR